MPHSAPSPRQHPSRRRAVLLLAASAATLGAIATVVGVGLRRAPDPARCPEGFRPMGPRCCSDGQTLVGAACVGTARDCPPGFDRAGGGCAVRPVRVRVAPGRLVLGPGDWEAQGVVRPRQVVVEHEFWIDSHEVTQARWSGCVSDAACPPLATPEEPGVAARWMTLLQARRFCDWAGGSLPSADQWVLAAAGAEGRRYAWGDTGAVCGRVDWGQLLGPCATGAVGPNIAGMHREDITPEGVVDLSGSVSEWVEQPDGPCVALGGSWRSSFAAELRTWHAVERAAHGSFDDVGFRCVYAHGGDDPRAQPKGNRP
jgi:formylglycine-generating enzyme